MPRDNYLIFNESNSRATNRGKLCRFSSFQAHFCFLLFNFLSFVIIKYISEEHSASFNTKINLLFQDLYCDVGKGCHEEFIVTRFGFVLAYA